ncbi:hypothetical protein [Vibrio caribbeanicus]|uniref:Uncharacterized protein n=1 Tax=Vibrio caribbeanicus ATCC BAA-2122 TaxID=796620 RepID=E3BML8_9VIBR|nr:hypothetical protein [Vibrio caribbeanicus]EFP95763.1 hypothetical protein VIBC2010_17470 [Vibrio caribbeanicus ATCC BAA-2122]
MKWFINFYITIAVISLTSVSSEQNRAYCDKKSWNKALKSEFALESKYNENAESFNKMLVHYQARPFLYQNFSKQEIQDIWVQHQSISYFTWTEEHESVVKTIEQLVHRKDVVYLLLEQAINQKQLWQEITSHCNHMGDKSNQSAGSRYVKVGDSRIGDVKELIDKLETLLQIYKREKAAIRYTK